MNLDEYNRKAQPIRDAINARPLTDFYQLTKSRGRNLYVCPICGSGTHGNKTGALSIHPQTRRVTCFSGKCFTEQGQDTLGALKTLFHGKSEREIFEHCGYKLDDGPPPAVHTAAPSAPPPMPADDQTEAIRAEVMKYAVALPGSKAHSYLQGRGLTDETMRRFHLGYDAQRDCVTIPFNINGTYYARRFLSASAPYKHGKLEGRKTPLFNPGALYAADTCFVVESPLCAISIEQAGGHAVALSGTAHAQLVEQLQKKPTNAVLILCLDNDEPGRKATDALDSSLPDSVFAVNGCAAIMDEDGKDPNEILQRLGAETLRQRVSETAAEALAMRDQQRRDAEDARRRDTGAAAVESFLQAVQSRRYEPIPTGIRDIDAAIGGGLIRQQLVILGAAPGVGKTALTQWLFETMAEHGTDVILLNLEMSREQLLARSLSRIIAGKLGGLSVRPTDILQGYRWTNEQRNAILSAADIFKQTIAPHLRYNPEGITSSLDNILEFLEQEAQQAEQSGLPVPIVALDYLQLIRGNAHEDAADTIKRAVDELKGYARRHNSLVLLITAHNRASNRSGSATLESGRDTSAIEYTADLQLALTYTACLRKDGKLPDELTEQERKNLTLRITKGRWAVPGREVDLHFDGESMTFTQDCKNPPPDYRKFTRVKEPTLEPDSRPLII